MPISDLKNRKDWNTPESYEKGAGELREALADLAPGDETRAARRELVELADAIDHEYKLMRVASGADIRVRSGDGAIIPSGGAGGPAPEPEHRSAGSIVVNDPEFKKWMERGAQGQSPHVKLSGSYVNQFRAEVSEAEYRTLVTAQGALTGGNTDSANTLLSVGQPYIANVRQRKLFIRDVMNVIPTTLSNVPYVREKNGETNSTGASTVAEAGTKPEATVQFTPDNAPATIIAVLLPVTTQVFRDGTLIMGYINTRLPYMLALREEMELLAGNGVWPDLKGIRTYSEIQTQSATSGETAITLGNAIAKVVLKDGYPNAVAMNPADSWAMKIKRAAGGSGTFDAGDPFTSVQNTVWGLPVVETRSMESGKALVGDYYQGATLFDHWAPEVRAFEQDSDNVQKNKVTLRAEESIALAVNCPDWFVLASL